MSSPVIKRITVLPINRVFEVGKEGVVKILDKGVEYEDALHQMYTVFGDKDVPIAHIESCPVLVDWYFQQPIKGGITGLNAGTVQFRRTEDSLWEDGVAVDDFVYDLNGLQPDSLWEWKYAPIHAAPDEVVNVQHTYFGIQIMKALA